MRESCNYRQCATNSALMTLPKRLEVLAALKLLITERKDKPPVEIALAEAPFGYVSAVQLDEASVGKERPREAAHNGFAVPENAALGDVCRVTESRTASGAKAADPWESGFEERTPPREEGELEPREDSVSVAVVRVETGAPLPTEAVAVVPMDRTTVVGTRRVRLEVSPVAGHGVRAAQPRSDSATPSSSFPVALGARLRARCAAAGMQTLRLRPRWAVGIAAIGDELVDPEVGLEVSRNPASKASVFEVTTPWIASALEDLGVTPVPLGIHSDDPQSVRDVLFRALSRQLDSVILVGGLGSGLGDRTAEGVVRFGASVHCEGLHLAGCDNFLYARGSGLDVYGLSGRPLAAAAGFDLLVASALRARQGAWAQACDWSRFNWRLEETVAGPRVVPVCRIPAQEGAVLRVLDVDDRHPVGYEQEGWGIVPESGVAHTAHFVPAKRW